MGKAGKSGITTNTPKNIMFGAGTIHKDLKYDASGKKWNFEESIMGATQGGAMTILSLLQSTVSRIKSKIPSSNS